MGEIAASTSSWRKGGSAITLEEYRRRGAIDTQPPPSRGTRTTEQPVVIGDWRARARCVTDKKPTSYFFPQEGDQSAWRKIISYCRPCPVAEQCAAYAIAESIPWGWFGGLSPQQRTNRVFDVRTATWKPRDHGFQRYRFGSHGKNPENGCRCDVCTEAARDKWAREQGRVRS